MNPEKELARRILQTAKLRKEREQSFARYQAADEDLQARKAAESQHGCEFYEFANRSFGGLKDRLHGAIFLCEGTYYQIEYDSTVAGGHPAIRVEEVRVKQL